MLTTAMKSVGEVMAIGRTFQESLQKALRGLETGLTGLDEIEIPGAEGRRTRTPSAPRSAPRRPIVCAWSPRRSAWASLEEVHQMCRIDPWFLEQIAGIIAMEARVREHGLPQTPRICACSRPWAFPTPASRP
jgi:carbamoyl-phosphate synthase large subunit